MYMNSISDVPFGPVAAAEIPSPAVVAIAKLTSNPANPEASVVTDSAPEIGLALPNVLQRRIRVNVEVEGDVVFERLFSVPTTSVDEPLLTSVLVG